MASNNTVVRTENLHKVYGNGSKPISVLNGISIEIGQSQMTAIMGPSGSGKSTLLHLIGGLDRPSDGHVHLQGQNIGTMSDRDLSRLRRQKIGFIFQFYNLLPALTALENAAMPLLLDGVPVRERARRAEAALAQVGLADFITKRPGELSGGQQQRVAVARAMVIDPHLILADEPTGALDSKSGEEVIELLRKVVTEAGHTVVIVTHDPRIAAQSDRIIYLRDGAIVDDTTIVSRSASEVSELVRQLMAG